MAALYDDKILLIFGGGSKSKTLNDLYSLDFETVCRAFSNNFISLMVQSSCLNS